MLIPELKRTRQPCPYLRKSNYTMSKHIIHR